MEITWRWKEGAMWSLCKTRPPGSPVCVDHHRNYNDHGHNKYGDDDEPDHNHKGREQQCRCRQWSGWGWSRLRCLFGWMMLGWWCYENYIVAMLWLSMWWLTSSSSLFSAFASFPANVNINESNLIRMEGGTDLLPAYISISSVDSFKASSFSSTSTCHQHNDVSLGGWSALLNLETSYFPFQLFVPFACALKQHWVS